MYFLVIEKNEITKRAKEHWNAKSKEEREKCGLKYMHFIKKFKLPYRTWDTDFDSLSNAQRNVIVKGELIRFYDELTNQSKTQIKNELKLSTFSSKWYKLPSSDKKTLLCSVIE